MADQHIMAELLRAPTEGYVEAIVVPLILAEQFELKHNQDSLNSAAGGNLLERRTQDVLTIIENKSKIAKFTHAVNQQTSDVTTAMTAILKQFQATPPPASVKAVEETCVTCGGAHPYYQCLAVDGNTFQELRDNIQGYIAVAAVNYNQVVPLSELEKVNRMNEANMKPMQTQINNVKNKLRNEMKNSIQASMSNQTNELKNMMASFFQMNIASTSGSGSIPSNTIANPKEELKDITTRSGIVLNGPSVLIPPPFINLEEDEHVEETLTDQDLVECTIKVPPPLKMLKALLSNKEKLQELANTPLNENCLAVILKKLPEKLLDLDSTKDLHSPHHVNPLSGSTTSSSSPNHLLEKFADELALITFPLKYDDDLPFDIKFDLKEIEYLLHYDPIKDMDSILKDLIDQSNLDDLNYKLVDTMPEMGEKIKESKLLIDELDLPNDFLPSPEYDLFLFEDFFEVDALPSTNNENKVFNPGILIQENFFEIISCVASDKKLAISYASSFLEDFDPPLYELSFFKEVPRGEKIKESKLLIDELDLPNDFLPSPEYDLFLFEDFFEVDALPSTNNENKVFNPGILIQENFFEIISCVASDKKLAISYASSFLEDFDPPLYELSFFKEVPRSKTLLLFSFENDPFDSKGEKIKESKLLIDELDLPIGFLPSSEYDSFLSEYFSKVDALPSTNNEDKVFNPGILIQENLFEIIALVAQDKKLAISHVSLMREDFDPPLYELPPHAMLQVNT
nr:hypothetical protein [Tanacetum cinerariifolium]